MWALLTPRAVRFVGFDKIVRIEASRDKNRSPFPGGKRLVTLDFVDEPWVPLEVPLGSERAPG